MAIGKGEYLKGIELLEKALCGKDPSSEASSFPRSMLTQMRPFLNGYDFPAPVSQSTPALSTEEAAKLRKVALSDAIPEIRAAAARTSIVIVNEAHHSPRDRAFGLAVARALRPLGYSILAAEAFDNPGEPAMSLAMAELQRDGYPRRSLGFYTQDPVFGDFVRQALALGYRPVAYEQTRDQDAPGSGIPEREQAQAENLAAIIKRSPGQKILIFVGFSHLAEAPIKRGDGWAEWMGARLKRMTGIDPLTVDQTIVTDSTSSRSMRQAYDLLASRLNRPAVMKLGGKPYRTGPYKDAVDLQIVHPRLELVRGRPAWLRGMGRRLRPIPAHLLPTRGRRLVQAFLVGEAQDAIPVEQVVVEAGKPAPGLMLPDKPVRFAVQDSAGAVCR